jgi:uncharacterized protein YndB with AHSA1/START domain
MTMDRTITPAPIRKTLVVKAEPAKAFEVFARRMHDWSPEVQSLLGKRRDIVVEPKADGRWYEVSEDGSQADWGRVLAWDPPNRLLLAWQLDANFQYDPKLTTEVEIRFAPVEGGRTRVDFEHRNLERFGDRADETRLSLDGEGGWSGSFALYVGLFEGAKA